MEQISAAESEFQMILIDITAGNVSHLTVVIGHPNLSAVGDLEKVVVVTVDKTEPAVLVF